MFHDPESDQRAGSTEASFAVDGESSWFMLSVVQELVYYIIFWAGAIQEVEVHVLDAVLGKLLLVVLWLVQSDNHGHAHLLENGDVVLRRERPVLISHIQWP